MVSRLLAVGFVVLSVSPALAGNFTVEFRNMTDRKVRVKTVKFDNTAPVTLNNGSGLDLNKAGQNGSKKSAIFNGDGNRVIIFWDATNKSVLAMQAEDLTDDFNIFVTLQPHPTQQGKFLIAVGALNQN